MNLLYPIHTEVLVVLLGLGALVFEAVRPFRRVRMVGHVLAGLVGALFIWSLFLQPLPGPFFAGAYQLDELTLLFKRVFLFATALTLMVAAEWSERLERDVVEHYVLLLLASVGLQIMAAAQDFILLFVALELVTISFYILVAHAHGQQASLEAGTKYLIMGGLSSGLIVYGMSYIFGTTGATHLGDVQAALVEQGVKNTALCLGVLLVLLGFSFKIAALPGHMWAPDVYQGGPLPSVSLLATGSKAAGFVVLVRLLCGAFLPVRELWLPTSMLVAAGTILYGNLGALGQSNVKRMLGYSSIAHSGYLLTGLMVLTPHGLQAVLFYVMQYAVSGLAGFLALAVALRDRPTDDIAELRGLWRRSPLAATALAASVLSLAGIPPLSGFMGKYLLFTAVLERAWSSPVWPALIAAAIAGVAVSLVFYFRLVVVACSGGEEDGTRAPVNRPMQFALWVSILATVGMGICPERFFAIARSIAQQLMPQ